MQAQRLDRPVTACLHRFLVSAAATCPSPSTAWSIPLLHNPFPFVYNRALQTQTEEAASIAPTEDRDGEEEEEEEEETEAMSECASFRGRFAKDIGPVCKIESSMELMLWILGWNNPYLLKDMLGRRGRRLTVTFKLTEEEFEVKTAQNGNINGRQSEQHDPHPVLMASLKAACEAEDLNSVNRLHSQIVRKGLLEKDVVLGNALVSTYAKCGSLMKAQEVFDSLPLQNIVSWNALIAGYAQCDRAEEALKYFGQMKRQGIFPDAVTFVCILKACSSVGAIDNGREIHAESAKRGLLERNVFVCNALVDMYAKIGLLVEAQQVFDKLSARNVVSWNALISGYAHNGLAKNALLCYEQMSAQGISPNAVSFVSVLKACGSIGATGKGQEIHAEIARSGSLERDSVVGTALLDMYAKCGLFAKAQELFDKLPAQNVVSWNALISGYVQCGCGEEALNCFGRMQLDGFSPDAVTYICILKACGNMGAIEKGQEIHAEIANKDSLERDLMVGTGLVDMYSKFGLLEKAREVFDKLPVRNVVTWSALITGYVQHSCAEAALSCFGQMQLEGFSPDAVTFVCILKACGSMGAIVKGRAVHVEIARRGSLERDMFVGNALIDMYAKCGLLTKAQEVFHKLPFRDVVSWNALITGYSQLGKVENVLRLFDKMLIERIKPDGVTFISVLNACSHSGLFEKGQVYFESMSIDYGISPTLDHYTCMIDLLGRAGQVDKALAMAKKMPFQANLVVWLTVLGACRKWGNVELGRQAFEQALQADEKDAAAYVCMSNIYLDAGKQEDADKVEAMRVRKQEWTNPGLC